MAFVVKSLAVAVLRVLRGEQPVVVSVLGFRLIVLPPRASLKPMDATRGIA